MVGLPARGKSFIVKKLKRYLSWLGYNTKRRRIVIDSSCSKENEKASSSSSSTTTSASAIKSDNGSGCDGNGRHSSNFFDPTNQRAAAIREKIAMDVLEDLIRWLQSGGQVAIHDATNSTLARRQALIDRLSQEPDINFLFVESICNDQDVITRNIKLKTQSPDYIDMDPVLAERDFRERLRNYERAYVTLGHCEENNQEPVQFCKIIDVGKKVIAYNIQGYIESQVVFYLMNINLEPRIIFLTRHGQSVDDVDDRIGGDSNLTESGHRFSEALTRFVEERMQAFYQQTHNSHQHCGNIKGSAPSLSSSSSSLVEATPIKNTNNAATKTGDNDDDDDDDTRPEKIPKLTITTTNPSQQTPPQAECEIWTSMLQKSIQTAQNFDPFKYTVCHLRALNEIYAGRYEGQPFTSFKHNHPEEYEARLKNKFYYRYPGIGGESYADIVNKLQQVIVELERKRHSSVMIISHLAIIRTLLSYFMDIPSTHMAQINVPLGYVFACEPRPFGNQLTIYKYIEEKDMFVKIDLETSMSWLFSSTPMDDCGDDNPIDTSNNGGGLGVKIMTPPSIN
ncbi:Fructose-2,6-bisphosphatase [Mycoemilia scoparia]|uniref:Fructose-2,6-bisphosphatase n=1 Tax=Mycoemilia scoparia TaxID=417184 RepID=A0A9W8DK96_9FUNG|nr:Fructose-2,6-bisphosphatase [Mycoemilia scoparia]